MTMSIFVYTELVKQFKVYQCCSENVYKNDDVQDFNVRWDQALISANETPTEIILEGLYTSKLQDSAQFQTVLALYDQETIPNNGQQSCTRWKTSVKLHIDQTMRTRSFRVRNEVVERGAETRSQKGKKAYVERRAGKCYQWKAIGQCSEGDSCSFRHDPSPGNRSREGQRAKEQTSSPAPNSKAKTGEQKTLQKVPK